jgi:hypothetical protein
MRAPGGQALRHHSLTRAYGLFDQRGQLDGMLVETRRRRTGRYAGPGRPLLHVERRASRSADTSAPRRGMTGRATSLAPAAAGACTAWHVASPATGPCPRRRCRSAPATRCRRTRAAPGAADLLARQQPLAAEHPRHEADVREVLDRLHLVVRREQVGAERERAVVGEQHPVVRLDVLPHGLGQLFVDGVAYSAIGTLPSVVTTSASTARSSGMPATANAVATGGCACTTALTSGRCRYTSRCICISDEGRARPRACVPRRSVMHIISGS